VSPHLQASSRGAAEVLFLLISLFAKEIVVLRGLGANFYSEDVRLHACTLFVEITHTQRRNFVILIHDGSNPGDTFQSPLPVPEEFQPFIELFYEGDLHKLLPQPPFMRGYHNGDLAYYWKRHPMQYDFLWAVEVDLRFVGDWDMLMTTSRDYGRRHVGSSK